MASKDIQTRIGVFIGLDIQNIVAQTEVIGNIVDLSTFRSASFALMVSAHTSGILKLELEDGNDSNLDDASDVPEEFLIGSVQIQIANEVKSIGYIGHKRFVRAKIVGIGGSVTATATVFGYADTRTRSPIPLE